MVTQGRSWGSVRRVVAACALGVLFAAPSVDAATKSKAPAPAASSVGQEAHDGAVLTPWQQLIREARSLGLPTGFLEVIPADFVRIEFEDLHTYAAEYHPADHRMVLNRTLSFNAAGSILRPLKTLPHRDIGTLFHELFHAYMDYLVADASATASDPRRRNLLAFARDRQTCRYSTVEIVPVVQRKAASETRQLSEVESWEALNETWAVFVGWAVWTKLEAGGAHAASSGVADDWYRRLGRAHERGELRGYYEPEDAEERALTKKRYLALTHRIAPDEAAWLMRDILATSEKGARAVQTLLETHAPPLARGEQCRQDASLSPDRPH